MAFVRVTVVVGGAVIEGGQPQDHTEFGVGSGIRDQGSGSEGGGFPPPFPRPIFSIFFCVFDIFHIFCVMVFFHFHVNFFNS